MEYLLLFFFADPYAVICHSDYKSMLFRLYDTGKSNFIFVYLLALVNRLLTSLVTASLSTIAVKSASGYFTVSRSMLGDERFETFTNRFEQLVDILGSKLHFHSFLFHFPEISNWFTRNSRRWLLRSIIFRSSRTGQRGHGRFSLFSPKVL